MGGWNKKSKFFNVHMGIVDKDDAGAYKSIDTKFEWLC